jgi:uncharacterized lipoprotein YddW (UPF0748 family)
MWYRRSWLLKLLILTIGFVTCFTIACNFNIQSHHAQTNPKSNFKSEIKSEIRGVWMTNVDSNVLFDRSQLTNAVQTLSQLNFNTLYPAVWNWGYTQYPSPVMQREIGAAIDPRPAGLQGRDPLAELVQQGHAKKLAVIPWFEFGFMVPEDSAIAQRHPEWLTRKQNGEEFWLEGRWSRVWLNPFKPEVQQFILNLVMELTTQYDIDGIQFDDHFGLPAEFGYDDFTVQLYKKEHQGTPPPSDSQNAEWKKWRADKITTFLTQVFRSVKAKKNHVLIGLSPNSYSFAYHRSLQDWKNWDQRGLIEELMPQIYRDSLSSFTTEMRLPENLAARQHIPTGIGILTGLKDKPVSSGQIREQVQAVRQQGFAGVSFFFYETLWKMTKESPIDRQALFKSLFPTPIDRTNIQSIRNK